MRPEKKSQLLLGVTRSKAKMLEYGVPEEHHIKITQDPAKLFTLSIGLLGDLAAAINREEPDPDSLAELKTNLLFSARFFDSYLQSKLNETLDPYLVLLGSASYYLCDLPGRLCRHTPGCPATNGSTRCKRIRSSRNCGLPNTFWARRMFLKASLPSFKCPPALAKRRQLN